jgi:hypothetical protein
MATKVLSLRVSEDLADWADGYAKARGVTRQALLEEGLRSFREDCERGVPEIKARARDVASKGVGECPKNANGHVWAPPTLDPRRPCIHCGTPGRGDARTDEQGNLSKVAAARAAFFQTLRPPMQNGTGDPKKAAR